MIMMMLKRDYTHFLVDKINIIYEQAVFNRHQHGSNESIDSFITALYMLAKDCNYGVLKEELI